MANVIQIKHGTSQPVKGTLKSFELGFDETNKKLYIGDRDENPLKIPVIKENQHYKDGVSGIDLQNSDIIGINGLYLRQIDSEHYTGTGIFFQSGDKWNRLYESGGELYYKKDVTKEDGANTQNLTYKIYHSGMTDLSISHIDFTKNQWLEKGKSAINLNNSDIIGANGIYFQDTAEAMGEGLFFRRTDEKDEWDRLYSYNGQLYYAPKVTMTTGNDTTSYEVYHSGMTIPIENGGTGATTKEGVITNIINGQSIEPSSIKVTSIKVDSITFGDTPKTGNDFAIDMKNSNIKGINSLRFSDSCQDWDEGIFFHREGTLWDKLYASGGSLYFWTEFNTELKKGDPNKNYEVYHSGLFSYESGLIKQEDESAITPKNNEFQSGSTSKVSTIYLGNLAIEYGKIECNTTWQKYTFKTIFSIPPIVTFTPCGSGDKPVPKLYDTDYVTEFDFVACLNSDSGTYFYLAIGPKLL